MKHKIIPQKKFGQNFLVNRGVQTRIVRSCHLKSSDFVLEIGPGKGALTKDLINIVDQMWAVERDSRCVEYLEDKFNAPHLKIIEKDILQFDWRLLPDNTKIIGNLPYNISTPILEKIIQHRDKISECFIMTQLEFARRLLAEPNTKAYGSLSCHTQLYMEGKILFKINNTSFYPPPKIMSAFIHFKTLAKPRFEVTDEVFLFEMIQKGFKHRRKMMIKNLEDYGVREKLEKAFTAVGVSLKTRAENCSLKDFVALADKLH